MTTQELIQKRDELLSAKRELLEHCFTLEGLADYMLDNGVVRTNKAGEVLPRDRAKAALLRTLYSDKNVVTNADLWLDCVPLDPDDVNAGYVCAKDEGDRRLRVELDRQERRLNRKRRSRNAASS